MRIIVLKYYYENENILDECFQIIEEDNVNKCISKSKIYTFGQKDYKEINIISINKDDIDFIYNDNNLSITKGNRILLEQVNNEKLILEWINNEHFINGLCFEIGFEKENKDLALEEYYQDKNDLNCSNGLMRIVKSDYRYGSKIGAFYTKIDNVKMAILYMKVKKFYSMYQYLVYRRPKRFNHVDVEILDNDVSDVRELITTEVIRHIDRNRYNDNNYFSNIYPMLASFYDDINKVPNENRKVYYEVTCDRDYYDGGTKDSLRIYADRIVETLQKEASKGDPLAIGALISYLCSDIDNEQELVEKLQVIAVDGNMKDKALASFFLGNYYKKKDSEKSEKYFKLAINNGSHYHKI